MAASQKLSHLLQLADQGPALRAALAEEVADLLTAWPAGYPESMRGVCEALLAKAAHDVDAPTRARLKVQLHEHPELARRVLPRETGAQALIDAARAGENLVAALGDALGVDVQTAAHMLEEENGAMLAVACKGAQIERAAFSALALLAHPARDRVHAFAMLDAYDRVAVSDAIRQLRGWCAKHATAA